ncbi:Glycine-rich protein [Melia azedarach]|uniref:Glycine-rich protein n=1 Tax=Melia azedarach TaxID=155640 RepID=A0ACC1XQ43_MELAZ|nr:Glycine-rich protein [Melia azedarach]
MGSKIFLLFGVSTAIFVLLLISSEVEARDLAESSPTTDLKKKAKEAATVPNGIKDGPYLGYGDPPGGYGAPPGGGYANVPRGSGCPYGCCRGGYNGKGCTCCSYAGQAAVQANNQPKPHN